MLNRIQSIFNFESRYNKVFVFSIFGAFLGLTWIFFASFQPSIDKFFPLYQTDLPLSFVRLAVGKPIEPPFPKSEPDSILNLQIFEGLTRIYKGVALPGVAQSWESENNQIWKFTIDDNAVFSNGEKVKASDVKFSFEKALQEKWPNQEIIAKIDSINIVDENTAEIKTKRPEAILPKQLVYFYVLSEKSYLEKKEAVGAGPYKIDSFANEKTMLSQNSFYYHEQPKVQKVEISIFADEKNRADSMLGGLVDIASFETSSDIDRLSKAGLQIKPFNLPQTVYLGINFVNSQLKNKEIRQAVAHAINPTKIIFDSGLDATTSNSLLPPELLGYDQSVVTLAFEPEKSREITDNKNLNFLIQTHDQSGLVSKSIAAQLAEVGIKTSVSNLLRPIQTTSGLFVFSFVPQTLDGQEVLEKLLATKNGNLGTSNFGGYSNQIIDQLVDDLTKTKNENERLDLVKRAIRIANDDIAYIPLYLPKVYLVTTSTVFGDFYGNGEIRIAELSGRGFVFKKR